MNAVLQIRIHRQNSPVSSFLTDRNLIRIGRGNDCEITLIDPMISALHLILRKKEEAWYLEDVSRNGLSLENSAPAPSRMKIEESRRFKLGRLYEIEIIPNPVLSETKERTLLSSQQPTQLLKVDGDQVTVAKAFIRIPKTNEARTLETQGLSLGSHPGNDFVIESEKVSQFHGRIDFFQNEFIYSDLNSTNGSFLNGQLILRAPLEHGGKLKLGDFEMEFLLEEKAQKIEERSVNEFMSMVTQDKAMQKVFSLAEVVAGTDAPVFISGETGTGKELLAKAVHNLSPRFEGPYLALNCAAFPDELMESELFGHEKGSFTGAQSTRVGAFESCHNGTLFLDEVAELDLSLQAKLLRTLESGEVKRVGSNRPVYVSVRIISASHKDLSEEVRAGRFREDLYFRLHVVPIILPPLRDRIDDLDLLVPHLMQKLASKLRVEPEAIEGLKKYSFPGNIRELKNVLQRAAIEYEVNLNARKEKDVLNIDHFRFLYDLKTYKPPMNPSESSERDRILDLLESCNYNQSEAARRMGVAVSTFHDKLKRYGIERKTPKVASA